MALALLSLLLHTPNLSKYLHTLLHGKCIHSWAFLDVFMLAITQKYIIYLKLLSILDVGEHKFQLQ